MPGLARKVLICAAVDGLILHPLNPVPSTDAPAGSRPPPLPLVKIKYGNNVSVSTVLRDHAPPAKDEPGSSFEAYGIVGIITVFHYSYLISITRRQQVANLFSKHPIYVVTEVALTPLTSQQEAADSISKTSLALKNRQQTEGTTSPSTSGDETSPEAGGLGIDELPASRDDAVESAPEDEWSNEATPVTTARSSIAQDVISRRGSYGRFAQRWFSRSGWAAENKRQMGLTADSTPSNQQKASNKNVPTRFQIPEGADGSEAAISLLPKLLRTAQILFGSSKTFFFSYDYDITRSFLSEKKPATGLTPLWKHVDGEYFWNGNVMKKFIDAGADGFVLPLMQGFVGEREFVVDSHPPQEDEKGKESVELSELSPAEEKTEGEGGLGKTERKYTVTVVSRRSTKRAGLRYLRRGIDEGGWVANGVETEQILYNRDKGDKGDKGKVYSFVQVRGSFPVFFTQSPYSLKPTPVLQHSQEANYAALRKHFERLGNRYGALQVVNLVEKHGVEAPIAELYERNIERLNEELGKEKGEKVGFEWFDFHSVCRGMKFENVNVLLGILGGELERFGSSTMVDGVVKERQKGVLRTNCMDCLDRTNVCQSSFGKFMLDLQLKEQEGIDMEKQKDQENSWFNGLWADNGDAIGKQYAGTGAMKGDYTRTRKRNYRGALTDAGLSLTRLFNGMFNDFFLQASIDFLLGNVTSLVFEEFEANMMTKDPAVSMQNMRQQAIELCQTRVVEDEAEEFIGGWTFLTPSTPDTVRGATFEEAVLLLTDVALYLCRFDWNLDKVSSFERVDLAHVTKVRFGTYITSTISAAQVDELRNVGLLVEYKPGLTDITRVNTRSLSSMSDHPKANEGDFATAALSGVAGFFSGKNNAVAATVTPTRKIALKALYSQTSAADVKANKAGMEEEEPEEIARLSEIQQVVVIAAEIERLAMHNQPREVKGGKENEGGEEGHLIEKGDIISVAEARKNTGLLETLGHRVKKLVWA
ncbi:putative recessive suppressor of secretory defect [Triangularia setosa]|uniref:Recessive suppressor of secretory defect n=1 Tax=Triangularia setosa TaxID=2587417 RepID=A0AAN6VZB8_9PEZI|nr:putative recessive suppressor of secretory defect [Podospora setosa]